MEPQRPLPFGHSPSSPPPPRQRAQSQLERASPPTERTLDDGSSLAACVFNYTDSQAGLVTRLIIVAIIV